MSDSTPVTRALDALNIPYRFFRHPGPVHNLEQAARERGQRPEQVVRSILFRLAEGEFLLVLVSGERQISWPMLRRYLGQSRLTLASPEEVLQVTGYQTGAVSPFGVPQPLRVIMDRGVLLEEEISLGSGLRSTTVILKTADLLKALSACEIASLTPEQPPPAA